MSINISPSDLSGAFHALMDGYEKAQDYGRNLDPLNRAFIRHVVAVSSNEAYEQLVERRVNNAEKIKSELKEFAAVMTKKDNVDKILSFAQAKVTAVLKWATALTFVTVGLTSIVTALVTLATNFGRSNPQLAPVLVRLFIVGGGGVLIKEYWGAIEEMFSNRYPAYDILNATLNQPEERFFKLIGATAPKRHVIDVIGPLSGIFLVFLAILVAVLVYNFFLAALSSSTKISSRSL
jgi:hypothetical protein